MQNSTFRASAWAAAGASVVSALPQLGMGCAKLTPLLILIFSLALAACERLTSPGARQRAGVAPSIAVPFRKFDTLTWHPRARYAVTPEPGLLERVMSHITRTGLESADRLEYIAVRDSAEWTAFWHYVAPEDSTKAPVPFIAFMREMVILVVGPPRREPRADRELRKTKRRH